MMHGHGTVIPFSFDLSSLLQRSVASLYSHLVTRPTGRALRLGIESQIGEIGSVCLSVLDFTQVVVLDYSCADEAVAKLIQRYQSEDRPADAYFVARGLGEQHRDPIDEVLIRHDLALVAEMEGEFTLLGNVGQLELAAWYALERIRLGDATRVGAMLRAEPRRVADALDVLSRRRLILRRDADSTSYHSLSSILQGLSAST